MVVSYQKHKALLRLALFSLIILSSTPLIARESLAPEFLQMPGAAKDLPFSDAVRVGPWLFLSGKIGNIPGTRKLAPGGIQGETRQAMMNIQHSLEQHGAQLSQVVKCSVFLADMAEWSAMNEVYVSFFPAQRPARSALGASGLALNARVEIECLAVLSEAAVRQHDSLSE